MKFELDKREEVAIFKLKEPRLDSAIATQVKSEFVTLLAADDIQNMLVDLSEVTFADSSGLSSLLVAHRMTNSKGGIFGLVGAQPAVEKLIGISHLDRVIMMYDNMDDAITDVSIQMEEEEEDEDLFGDPKAFDSGKPAGGKVARRRTDSDEDGDEETSEFDELTDFPEDDDLGYDEDYDDSPRRRR